MKLTTALWQATYLTETGDDRALSTLLDQVLASRPSSNPILDGPLVTYIAALLALAKDDGRVFDNPQLDPVLADIKTKPKPAGPSLCFSEDTVYHTSSIGLVYGALRRANLYIKDPALGQIIRDLRAYVFDTFIAGGMVVSDHTKENLRFDTLLACVPFGLFEPEDLVLVEAVKVLKERAFDEGTSDHERLLLALYYVEQGSYDLARKLLFSCKKTDDSSQPIHWLNKLIGHKLEDLGQLSDYFLLHQPEGNGNRYEPLACQRHPLQVYANDCVVLDVQAVPHHRDQPVEMLVTIKGQEEVLQGDYLQNRWTFALAPQPPEVQVSYAFRFAKRPQVQTEFFAYTVGVTRVLSDLESLTADQEAIHFYGKGVHLGLEASGEDLEWVLDQAKSHDHLRGLAHHGDSDSNGNLEGHVDLEGQRDWQSIKMGVFHVAYRQSPFALTVTKEGQPVLQVDGDNPPSLGLIDGHVKDIRLGLLMGSEAVYGLGERYNALNQRGSFVDQFVYNQYKDQGVRTYIPMPLFYTTAKYGLKLHTDPYSWFQFNDSGVQMGAECGVLKGLVATGSLTDQVSKLHHNTGSPKMVPKWALGPWMSSNNWDSEEEVRKQVALTKHHDIPSTVLVIEAWSDEATFYIFNDAIYEEKRDGGAHTYGEYTFPEWGRWPDPKGMVNHLHDNDLKCVLWQIPIIKQISSLHHLQKNYDEKRFVERGYGVTHPDGRPFRMPEGWFKDSLLMDFSNEEAKQWWFDKRQYLIDDLKVDGFKTDGGEFVFGRDLQFADGRTGLTMRNAYPNDYVKAYYDFAQQNDGITFSRAGYMGAQEFPAHWAGDERSTFDAFKRSMLAGLSAGLSGVIFWGWDLGGFSGDVPTAELFIRSAQMATFCPIMQYHAESKAELNQDRTPWNIADRSGDQRALSAYRYFANVRMTLLPYIYEESLQAVKEGQPLMRAMVLDNGADPKTHNMWDQYRFGRKLLIAPVIEEGAREKSVYLPEGNWWHLFDNTWYKGGQTVSVTAGMDQIPVFVPENTVVPLNMKEGGQLGDSVGSKLDRYGRLTFVVTGASFERYTFTDDMGNELTLEAQADVAGTDIQVTTSGQVDGAALALTRPYQRVKVNGEDVTPVEEPWGENHVQVVLL